MTEDGLVSKAEMRNFLYKLGRRGEQLTGQARKKVFASVNYETNDELQDSD